MVNKKYHIICKLCGKEYFLDYIPDMCEVGCDNKYGNFFEIHNYSYDCFLGCEKYNEIQEKIDFSILFYDTIFICIHPKLKKIFFR